MSNKSKEDLEFIKLITQINEVLNEIKNEQINLKQTEEKNHKVNMQKFSRLLEYNEISDMTNKVFEKRISNIEKLLYEVFRR